MEVAVMTAGENFISRVKQGFSEQEKKEIVMTVLRGENSLDSICETFDIEPCTFFQWSKEFLEAENRKLTAAFIHRALNEQESELKSRVELVKKRLSRL